MIRRDALQTHAPSHELDTTRTRIEVVVTWGAGNILSVAHLPERGRFVLGDSGDTDLVVGVSDLGAHRFALIEDGRLWSPPQCAARTSDGGVLPDGVEVGDGVEAAISLGDLTIHVRRVAEGKRVAPRRRMDKAAVFYVGGTLALAGVMLAIMALSPPRGMAMSMDRLDVDSRLVSYLLEEPAFEEPQVELLHETADFGNDTGPATPVHDLPEPEGPPAPSTRAYRVPEPAAPSDVLTAGVLQTLSEQVSFDAPSPFTTPLGTDPMVALSVLGVQLGDEHGHGGLRLSAGSDGACPDCIVELGGGGLLDHLEGGAGGYGVTCGARCRAARRGHGYGSSAGQFATREGRTPTVGLGGDIHYEVRGSLSREVIRRVVRRHHNEIKHCYERALHTNPTLEGRVTTRFIISPAGVVTTASVADSSLRHEETETCVTNAIRRFTFPSPDNGGMVGVTYPFTFTSR